MKFRALRVDEITMIGVKMQEQRYIRTELWAIQYLNFGKGREISSGD